MLQSICLGVYCSHKFCHWKGQLSAWLPLQTFRSPLTSSSLLENPRGEQASGFSLFLEVEFHIEPRKTSYSRVLCHLEKSSSVIPPTHYSLICSHQLIQIED